MPPPVVTSNTCFYIPSANITVEPASAVMHNDTVITVTCTIYLIRQNDSLHY